MAELRIKDLRMPEIRRDLRFPVLRLPEMSRDDIARALGEARKELVEVRRDLNDFRRDMEMPKVDLSRVETPKVELPKIEMPKVDLGKVEVPEGVRKAAESAGIVKTRPSRMPWLLGGALILGLIAWVVANSPSIQDRLRRAAQEARGRMDDMDQSDEARAFNAAVAVPVEPSAYTDSLGGAESPFAEPPSDLPEGMGSEGSSRTIDIEDEARARS